MFKKNELKKKLLEEGGDSYLWSEIMSRQDYLESENFIPLR